MTCPFGDIEITAAPPGDPEILASGHAEYKHGRYINPFPEFHLPRATSWFKIPFQTDNSKLPTSTEV